MSGHSKWAQIKHKKSATDAKKGQLFSKLAKMITIAAKELGTDPKINSKLSSAIEEAKTANMPNDNIERAIKRATEKYASELKEVTYEAYGPGGSAIIITAITDSSNRTTNEIKHLLSEHGGKLENQGSAMWAFIKSPTGEYVPNFPVALSEDNNKKFESLLEALDNQDDVENVFSNIE